MKYMPIDLPGIWYTKLNQNINEKEYLPLCRELKKEKYRVIKASEALKLFDEKKLHQDDKVTVIWIHDIESPCENWLSEDMAILEADHGLSSTHNIRIFSMMEEYLREPLFNIVKMGGEIQYQYEELVATRGNVSEARTLFRENLLEVRKYFPDINIAFSHGVYLSGIEATDQFKDQAGKWQPSVWIEQGIHPLGELYYFMELLREKYERKFHYFGEGRYLGADEFLHALNDTGRGDVVMFLQHPMYWSTAVDIAKFKKCARESTFFV